MSEWVGKIDIDVIDLDSIDYNIILGLSCHKENHSLVHWDTVMESNEDFYREKLAALIYRKYVTRMSKALDHYKRWWSFNDINMNPI